LQKNYVGAKKSVNELLESIGSVPLKGGVLAYELLKRPGIKFEHVLALVPDLQSLNLHKDVMEELEIITKFEGYIMKQKREADNVRKIEEMNIPLGIDYLHMDGLRIEARQKLNLFRPLTIGQASRISGVNPCDVTILILNVKRSQGYE
jgi:tRNA uridine 5-carboxymethylaminomethyl modification enzyme